MLSFVSFFIIAGCSQQTKYVCPDGSTVSDSSSCPKKVECLYNFDCGNGLECVNNHCIRAESTGPEGVRIVECNALKSCKEGYTCSNSRCVKI